MFREWNFSEEYEKDGQFLWRSILPESFRRRFEIEPIQQSKSNRVTEKHSKAFVTNYCSNPERCMEISKAVYENYDTIQTIALKSWNIVYCNKEARVDLFNLRKKIKEWEETTSKQTKDKIKTETVFVQ